MKQKLKIVSFFLISSFMILNLNAQNAQDLYKEASPFPNSATMTLLFKMTIHDDSGEKTRELQIQSVKKKDTYKILAKIVSPSSLSGLKFLRIATNAQSTQTWLKTSRGVRRIADTGNSNEKLFNSDFTVTDLTQNTITNHVIESITSKKSDEYYIVKDTDAVGLAKIVTFKKENNIIESIEYIDTNGTNIKNYQVEEWSSSNNVHYPKLIRMTDKIQKSWTTLEVIKIDFKTPISDSIFNSSSL